MLGFNPGNVFLGCCRALHTDRGGEFTGKDFRQFLKSKGIAQKLTVHDTLEHNGVAERLEAMHSPKDQDQPLINFGPRWDPPGVLSPHICSILLVG
jgi:transposase InsO family protein